MTEKKTQPTPVVFPTVHGEPVAVSLWAAHDDYQSITVMFFDVQFTMSFVRGKNNGSQASTESSKVRQMILESQEEAAPESWPRTEPCMLGIAFHYHTHTCHYAWQKCGDQPKGLSLVVHGMEGGCGCCSPMLCAPPCSCCWTMNHWAMWRPCHNVRLVISVDGILKGLYCC